MKNQIKNPEQKLNKSIFDEFVSNYRPVKIDAANNEKIIELIKNSVSRQIKLYSLKEVDQQNLRTVIKL